MKTITEIEEALKQLINNLQSHEKKALLNSIRTKYLYEEEGSSQTTSDKDSGLAGSYKPESEDDEDFGLRC